MSRLHRAALAIAIVAACRNPASADDAKADRARLAALKSPDAEVRRQAARALAAAPVAASEARAAVAALRAALKDTDDGVRADAAEALGRMGPAARSAFRDLAERAVTDYEWPVRSMAALALVRVDQKAGVAELRKALRDPDPAVRVCIAWAIGSVANEVEAAAEPLRQALRDRERAVRISALAPLRLRGLRTPGVISAVLPALKDADPAVRAHALATLVPAELDRTLVSLLATMGQDAEHRRAVAEALARIYADKDRDIGALEKAIADPAGALAAPAGLRLRRLVGLFGDLLGHDNLATRRGAARELGRLGPAAAGAAQALTRALADKDWSVRFWAADALVRCGAPAQKAVPLLVQALTDAGADANNGMRVRAAEDLGRLGVGSAALATALHDPEPEVRQAAARALRQIGGKGASAIPDLAKSLRDPDPALSGQAALALSKMGALAVGPLQEALKDPSPDVRASAASALGRIGKAARSAAPSLSALLKDPEPYVRLAAAEALKRIDADVARRAGVK